MAFRSNSTSMPFPITNNEQMHMNNSSPVFQSGGKGPDPLSGNWNYDSAIDLFSLNTMVDPFRLDLSDHLMNFDPREFPGDAFAPPVGISGFTISNHSEDAASCGSISSDPESDDQLWSPTMRTVSSLDSAPVDIKTEPHDDQLQGQQQQQQQLTQSRRKLNPHKRQHTTTARWSSSPEVLPQEYNTPHPVSPPKTTATSSSGRKLTRSLSGASNSSNNPTVRNAAKRAAHNIIEKRYRTNMNAKFVALEKAMSENSSNTTTATTSNNNNNNNGCNSQKQTKNGSSASLKKSEILTNAIAYMEELQEENKMLREQMAMRKHAAGTNANWRHVKTESNFPE